MFESLKLKLRVFLNLPSALSHFYMSQSAARQMISALIISALVIFLFFSDGHRGIPKMKNFLLIITLTILLAAGAAAQETISSSPSKLKKISLIAAFGASSSFRAIPARRANYSFSLTLSMKLARRASANFSFAESLSNRRVWRAGISYRIF